MITKFIEPWILIPGVFVVVLTVLGVLLVRTGGAHSKHARRVPVIGWIVIAVALSLYLLSTEAVSRSLLGNLERSTVAATLEDMQDAQAVVVLGGGVVADAPSEELLSGYGRDSLAPEAESRLLYGMRLAQRLGVPIVVTGGRVFPDDRVDTEASVAQRLLLDLGFPAERIMVEENSRTTAENALYTARQFSWDTVVVVTSAWHMRRAIGAFRRTDMTVYPAPAPFRTDRRSLKAVHFMPSAKALYNSSQFVRETLGHWYYQLVRL